MTGDVPAANVLEALHRAARRAPEHGLPPAEHLVWWDRGVRDGVELGLIYAEEAVGFIRTVLETRGASEARTETTALKFLFDTVHVPRRDDGRVIRVRVNLEGEGQPPLPEAANPRFLESLAGAAAELLGDPGRMVSASKTHYFSQHPDHPVLFNANICVAPHWKVWYGDIDLTLDEPVLRRLAMWLERPVYVLNERDGRFDGRDEHPLIERAIYTARPDGASVFAPPIERGEDGGLRRPPTSSRGHEPGDAS